MLSLKKLSHLFHGFTLVELIVVISVLAVLATIAMSQVSNITAWARDSQRMTDMSSMKSSIELYKAKTGKLPIPTNGSGVTYSWGLLWIQGTFGESVVREIKSITPKPIDPINKIEYVYSIANNNREFELGGILEKATGLVPSLFPELLAASQNTTFIEWTYNGISLKVETGSKTYIVAAPSLIGGYLGATMETSGVTIEGLWSLPLGFSGVVVSTANTGTFTPIIAWSGSKLPETSTWAEALVTGLQNAYSGSVATSLSQISSLIAATGSQITALGQGLIQNSLGGTVITLPTATNTSTGGASPGTPEADPYAGNVVSLLHFDGNLNDEMGKVWSTVLAPSDVVGKFWSGVYFNAANNLLSTPFMADFDFWTWNFTIDMWINPKQSDGPLYTRCWSGNNYFILYLNGWKLTAIFNHTTVYNSNLSVSLNAWHHIALVRSGSTILLAVDGVTQSFTGFNLNLNSTMNQAVGIDSYTHGEGYYLPMYLDEFRITKWVARWTSDFTPPSVPITFPSSHTLGSTSTNPWTTCKAIYDAGRRIDGVYWIKPDTNPAFQVYCNMTQDGGGWTLVGKSTSDGGSLYNTSEITGYLDTTLKTAKLSDARINAVLATSSEKIIRVTSPSVTTYNNYIKIDSPTEQWNSMGRMCNMRWTDSLASGLWTKKVCTYQATGQTNGWPGAPSNTNCDENSLITSGNNYYHKTDGTCVYMNIIIWAYWAHNSYSPPTVYWDLSNTGHSYNSLWFVR